MTGVPRLLVVDDDPTIREMLEMVLDSEGYAVTTAQHGLAAFALLDEVRPHVILLDMKMPVMDGWGFLERYRQRPGPKVPVVVLTAAQDDSRRPRRPGAIDDLIRVLDRCLGAGACAAGPESAPRA